MKAFSSKITSGLCLSVKSFANMEAETKLHMSLLPRSSCTPPTPPLCVWVQKLRGSATTQASCLWKDERKTCRKCCHKLFQQNYGQSWHSIDFDPGMVGGCFGSDDWSIEKVDLICDREDGVICDSNLSRTSRIWIPTLRIEPDSERLSRSGSVNKTRKFASHSSPLWHIQK